MSKQVLDISQMQHLNELGVDTSKASMKWVNKYYNAYGDDFEKVPVSVNLDTEYYQSFGCAFTLQDILELLPNKIDDELILFIEKGKHKWRIGYTDIISDEIFEDFSDKNFIDATYEVLCWCIENGYLEKK